MEGVCSLQHSSPLNPLLGARLAKQDNHFDQHIAQFFCQLNCLQ